MAVRDQTVLAAPNALTFQRDMLRAVSRTFALTIPELPLPVRTAVGNAYLWCRIADTIEDAPALSVSEKHRLFEMIHEVLAGNDDGVSFARKASEAVRGDCTPGEFELVANTPLVLEVTRQLTPPQQAAIVRCVRIMATGMEQFQAQQDNGGLKTRKDLDAYCYCVAGVVGEMLTEFFCAYSEDIAAQGDELRALAVSFGEGLQLTNILKDVWDDRERSVCWLPADLFASQSEDAFAAGIQSLVGVARGHLEDALRYVTLIPRSETGIRRFCLYALGMAILTLRNIHRNPHYRSADVIKINRRTVYGVVGVSRVLCGSNFLLRQAFAVTAHGLPK